jgi:predicted transcriptional regulator
MASQGIKQVHIILTAACPRATIFVQILVKGGCTVASKAVHISLPEELLKEIDRVARIEKCTRSELFREAARHYLKARGATSWTAADRKAFEGFSATAFNRLWDNPIDAQLWDGWKERHARKAKAR